MSCKYENGDLNNSNYCGCSRMLDCTLFVIKEIKKPLNKMKVFMKRHIKSVQDTL